MAGDELSDACSRTNGDGAKGGCRNKRKSTQACSYPNKKHGFTARNKRVRYLIEVFTVIVFVLIDLLIEEDEDQEEKGDEYEEAEARADLLKAAVDCLKAITARVELELGPENPYIKKILGLLHSAVKATARS